MIVYKLIHGAAGYIRVLDDNMRITLGKRYIAFAPDRNSGSVVVYDIQRSEWFFPSNDLSGLGSNPTGDAKSYLFVCGDGLCSVQESSPLTVHVHDPRTGKETAVTRIDVDQSRLVEAVLTAADLAARRAESWSEVPADEVLHKWEPALSEAFVVSQSSSVQPIDLGSSVIVVPRGSSLHDHLGNKLAVDLLFDVFNAKAGQVLNAAVELLLDKDKLSDGGSVVPDEYLSLPFKPLPDGEEFLKVIESDVDTDELPEGDELQREYYDEYLEPELRAYLTDFVSDKSGDVYRYIVSVDFVAEPSGNIVGNGVYAVSTELSGVAVKDLTYVGSWLDGLLPVESSIAAIGNRVYVLDSHVADKFVLREVTVSESGVGGVNIANEKDMLTDLLSSAGYLPTWPAYAGAPAVIAVGGAQVLLKLTGEARREARACRAAAEIIGHNTSKIF